MSQLSLLQKFLQAGSTPGDSDDEQVRKSSLLLMSALFAMAGLMWGVLYFFNGLALSGSIPFTYGVLSVISILIFVITKKYRFFRFSQIVMILILPFLLQLSLGGFVAASSVILWALISPLGALVFYRNPFVSLKWFIAYAFIIVIAFILNKYVDRNFKQHMADSFIIDLFLMNILGVSVMVFIIQYYFVNQQYKLKKLVDEKSAEIEQKNKDIVDSIQYAKRIQQTLMPTEVQIERNLKRLQEK